MKLYIVAVVCSVWLCACANALLENNTCADEKLVRAAANFNPQDLLKVKNYYVNLLYPLANEAKATCEQVSFYDVGSNDVQIVQRLAFGNESIALVSVANDTATPGVYTLVQTPFQDAKPGAQFYVLYLNVTEGLLIGYTCFDPATGGNTSEQGLWVASSLPQITTGQVKNIQELLTAEGIDPTKLVLLPSSNSTCAPIKQQ